MRHELHGLVTVPEVVDVLAERYAHVRPVLLDGAELVLVPMCDELVAAVELDGFPVDPAWGFERLTSGLAAVLTASSRHGPVAYLETDYTGGLGWQSAAVWLDCHLVHGPCHLEPGDPFPAAEDWASGGSPIVGALRYFGVSGVGRHDAFVVLGLGRHRTTAEWCAAWSRR